MNGRLRLQICAKPYWELGVAIRIRDQGRQMDWQEFNNTIMPAALQTHRLTHIAAYGIRKAVKDDWKVCHKKHVTSASRSKSIPSASINPPCWSPQEMYCRPRGRLLTSFVPGKSTSRPRGVVPIRSQSRVDVSTFAGRVHIGRPSVKVWTDLFNRGCMDSSNGINRFKQR